MAAGVSLSSVATSQVDSLFIAASVSFPAGSQGLEAAVRFVHALDTPSRPLIDPPLALYNTSVGAVSIASLDILGVRSLCVVCALWRTRQFLPLLPALCIRTLYPHWLLPGCGDVPARCVLCPACSCTASYQLVHTQ